MKVQVTVNNVKIIEPSVLNENEYNIHECEFEFTEEYNGLTKKAVFTNQANETYVETIVDDKCSIPSEVLKDKENVKLGVYAYDVENEELLLRYSPRPTEFYVHEGSYKEGQNSTPPTPSEVEQLQAQITSNKNDIEEMQGDIVDINSDIVDIKAEQITQNEYIQANSNNIVDINGQIVDINQDIDNLESTKADKSEIPTKTSDLINDSDFVSDSNYVHTDNNFTNEKDAQITTNASNITTLQNTKADKTEIPTKTSQLTNDSGFITKNVDDLANYYKKSETYNKTEIDVKVSSVYKYKGTVATYQDLPSTDLTIGDVYNVEEDGSNYAWTGNSWDKLGGDIDLSEYYTKTQTDSLLSAKANSSDVYTKNETYNKTEVNTLLNDKVDKVQGKGLSTNDFTDNYKNQIETNQTAITNIKDGTTIDSFGDVETALSGKEDTSNKVVELSNQSTDTQYPSAKCVYYELEIKQSEIDTLQQDVEDLRGASYKVEGTGTDITLNNTAQARLLKNELSGRTEQEQLSGKNLFNKNDSDIRNGWINENGLPNGNTSYDQKVTGFIAVTANETYIQNKANINNYLAFYDENKKFIAGTRARLASTGIFTVPNDAYYVRTGYFVYETDEFQIELGSTVTSYESYCGGIPSPNPGFPQPIKNVTGNANVKIQNKNLAWTGWAEDFVNRIDNEFASKIIEKDNRNCLFYTPNAGYGDYANKYIFKINFKQNTRYTFSFDILKTGAVNRTFAIYYTDGTYTAITDVSSVDTWEHKTVVSSANKTVLYATAFYTNGGTYIDINTFQVEEGTSATSYVPHQEQNLQFTFAEGQFLADNEKLKDNGMYKKWNQVTFSGTTITLEDAKSNGAYFCNKKVSGNLVDKTLSFDEEVTDAIIQYELAEEEIITYNSTQQTQYQNIKNVRSYDDQTNITSTSDELGFNMDVESLGNINKVINNLLNN